MGLGQNSTAPAARALCCASADLSWLTMMTGVFLVTSNRRSHDRIRKPSQACAAPAFGGKLISSRITSGRVALAVLIALPQSSATDTS